MASKKPDMGRTSRRGQNATNTNGRTSRGVPPASTTMVNLPGATTPLPDYSGTRDLVRMQHNRWRDPRSTPTGRIDMDTVMKRHRARLVAKVTPIVEIDPFESLNKTSTSPVTSIVPQSTKRDDGKENRRLNTATAKAPPGFGGPIGRPALNENNVKQQRKEVIALDDPRIHSARQRQMLGGAPIDPETAVELRQVVYGSVVHRFTSDWKKMGIKFQDERSPYPWGIQVERNGSRGMLMCVQAFIIKHLVFKYETKDEIYSRNVLDPTPYQRSRALQNAICEILWRAGDEKRCCVCIPQTNDCFGPMKGYNHDGITERLRLFEFNHFEDVERFIKRNLSYFENSDTCGLICFLYSLALSRTIPKILSDLNGNQDSLMTNNEGVTQALINLLLTGEATTNLHNGHIVYDDDGEVLTKPMRGVPNRAEAGMLWFDKDEEDDKRTQVGSMFKTPKKPIWVTFINNQYGLLFCLNPELVGNWRSEHRFVLHYYTGLPSQKVDVKLDIDTRYGRSALNRVKSGRRRREEEKKIPSLERCIMTKWHGCTVNWNGVLPFVS